MTEKFDETSRTMQRGEQYGLFPLFKLTLKHQISYVSLSQTGKKNKTNNFVSIFYRYQGNTERNWIKLSVVWFALGRMNSFREAQDRSRGKLSSWER